MKTRNKILTKKILYSILMMFMVGWVNSAWAGSDPIKAIWDFTGSYYEERTISFGNEEELDPSEMNPADATTIKLIVDTKTNSTAKLKIENNKNHRADFNWGTIMRIPVISTKDVVTVTIQDDANMPKESVMIGGTAISDVATTNKRATKEYKVKAEDVEQGYVEITAIKPNTSTKNNTYIYYISVTQYPPVYEEKCLYSTDFQNWEDVGSSNSEKEIKTDKNGQAFQTIDGQDLSFYFMKTSVDNDGEQESKKGWYYSSGLVTKGWMRADKSSDAYVRTSILKNVTKIKFVQASTSAPAGWGLKVIDKDGNEEVINNEVISQKKGEEKTIEINRDNVQLLFYNLSGRNFAFMTSFEIYGNVEVKEDINITYYDTDGITVLGTEKVSASEPLKFNEEMEKQVTVPSGSAFRGWFDGIGDNAEKVRAGSELSIDLFLYAKATPIEQATDNSYYEYNMTKSNFYQEDHELIEIEGGVWHDVKHGWNFSKGGTIKLTVAAKAHIDMTLCNQGKDGSITVTDGNGNTISTFGSKATTDATVQGIDYKGETPTTLTINVPAGAYIHGLNLFNYLPVYVKFDFSGLNIVGSTSIEDILCDANTGMAKMPNNLLFYREGWSFKGWTDGTNLYEADKEYKFTETTTLKPKMVANTIDLTDTNTPIEIVWPFDYREAPAFNSDTWPGKQMPYTKSVNVEGEKYDVTLYMDASQGGKVTNQDKAVNSFAGIGGQFNTKTVFTLPAVYGMTVTIHASDKVDDRNSNVITMHFGDDENDAKINITDGSGNTLETTDGVISTDKKTITFTYNGDDKKILINVKQASVKNMVYGFYKDITVTYPVLPTVECVNTITSAEDKDRFPNEKAELAGSVTMETTITDDTKRNTGKRYKEGEVITITAKANPGYTFMGFRSNGTVDQTDPYKYTVTAGTSKIEALFERQELYRVTVKSSDVKLGLVSISPIYENFYNTKKDEDGTVTTVECYYTKDTEVTVSGEAIINYMLGNWTEDNKEVSTITPYVFTMGTTDRTLVGNFKLGNQGSVIFKIEGSHVNGVTEAYKGAYSMTDPYTLSNVRSFVVPTNYPFYKNVNDNGEATANGYTLRYWIDERDKDKAETEQNRYELGKVYSFSTANETVTLIPHFEYNATTADNRQNKPIIRYDFGRNVHEYYDQASNQILRASAQDINIGNNEKPFWTTDTYMETLQNGELYPHTRDVALWCDTGSKGYIRNTDLEDWASFGPGTTFWLPSNAGSKISLLTYAKISTTTIDGKVPTLDAVRTDSVRKASGSEKMYVYTYTTQNPDARIPLVIGDDYSYYQWLEICMPAANMVNLHATSVDESRGEIKEIESLSEFKEQELEDGGYAFHQGDRVRMTVQRRFGYVLDKIVDPDKTDSQGNPLAVLKMNDDGSVNMVNFNNASTTTRVEKNADGTWGDAKNTVFTLKEVAPTAEELKDSLRTHYEIEFEITTHRKLQAYFKIKDTYYVTYNAGDFATGTPPEVAWLEAGDEFTIPRNQTLYYEGNTLSYWRDDEGNRYEINSKHVAEAKDLRLFPVFDPNELNILDLDKEATATWYFAKNDGAPTISYQGSKGILVTQLTQGDKSIDIKIDLDATKGKFNNVDGNPPRPERIQINGGSVIIFPATPHCVARLETTSNRNEKVEIEGKQLTVTDSKVETECTADNSQVALNFIGGPYSRLFSVTYKPQTATKADIETLTCGETTYTAEQIEEQISTTGHVTFTVAPWDTNETIPEVTGTATEGGTVTATRATIFTKACVATVKTKSGIVVKTYPIEFKFGTPTDYPKFVKININGTEYTDKEIEISDVAQSGMIRITFDRTMNTATITDDRTSYNSKVGKELVFKYWDQPLGSTLVYDINTPDKRIFRDIYGMECQDELKLTLHITDGTERIHHHKFDFIVGKDGTMDEAIAAANSNTKENNHRYFIFVPDGDYKLTGNEPLLSYSMAEQNKWPKDDKGVEHNDKEMLGKNNGRTLISKPNVSLIGQSKEGVTIWNYPLVEGIGYTSTIHVGKQATDFYAQDITLENKWDYQQSLRLSGKAGRAVVFWDQGNRSIMKRVALKSWQDTYYSSNVNSDYRGYFENSDLYGVVDWLCGSGDILFNKCNLIVRDRTGNNIAAPSTDVNQEWGYVMLDCNIKPELDHPTQLRGNDWTLARPWGSSDDKVPASPACTYINTRMYTLPRNYGWTKMGTGLILRFHEYNSMNGAGNPVSLNTRSLTACSPAPGSDDWVLSDELSKNYTVRNIMGGPDAFEPNEICKQIDAKSGAAADQDENHEVWDDQLELDDDNLVWQAHPSALCYFVFKLGNNGKWIYMDNTTETSINISSFGSGEYCVRAANQRGGLGAATDTIQFSLRDPYVLEIKQTGDLTVDGVPYGWSTICLPFNAKVPEGVKTYAVTAHNKETADEKVIDLTVTLSPVAVIDSLKGYVVYGPAGTYHFNPTSRSCDRPTILEGNPTGYEISATNINCYVLANKSWGLGFYKFTGSTLKPYKAWLPQDMVSTSAQDALATGARAIRFSFDTSDMPYPIYSVDYAKDDALYTIGGQKVDSMTTQGIYVSRKRGKILKR